MSWKRSEPGGETNVRAMICGTTALESLENELEDFIVTTMELPWSLARGRIGAAPKAILYADSMERDDLELQIEKAPPASMVLALGGGRAVDLGKYLAWRRGLRLVTVPSVLSVDAFVTPAAGIRQQGQVVYVGEATPDPLVIDYELLRTAPSWMNVSGVGDLLSIHTATHDWELARDAGKSEYPFSESAVGRARLILNGVREKRDAIRLNSDAGLQAIVDGYLQVNEICLPAGHYRVEEGSEHYLFYELEERLRRPFMHGPIVGLGIAVLSALQENDPEGVVGLMRQLGLPFEPGHLGIDRPTLTASLLALRDYVRRREDLWYTVIDERPLSEDRIHRVLEGLDFDVPRID